MTAGMGQVFRSSLSELRKNHPGATVTKKCRCWYFPFQLKAEIPVMFIIVIVVNGIAMP